VFFGLGVTGLSSLDLGTEVVRGTALVTFGSALHALMYVLSELIMNSENEKISAKRYCGVYGSVACSAYFLWQIFYTRYHFQELILEPMAMAGTTYAYGLFILSAICFMSMVHSVTFFHTVKYVPGGSTSAGVLKALQAVLVFAATSLAFCHQFGGEEMCFTFDKLVSLCIVVAGVVLFGKATEVAERSDIIIVGKKGTYKRINSHSELELEAAMENRL